MNLFNNTSTSTTTGSDTVTAAAVQTSKTSEMFTKLLVAQIKNQDPLSPSDPTQFVNQLAQLSQTESLQSLSNLTSTNASMMQSMQVLALGSQVGSDVTVSTSTLQLGTDKVEGSFALDSASAKTSIVLTSAGGVSREVPLGARGAGTVGFTLDPVALGLPGGSYSVKTSTSTGATPAIDIVGKINNMRVSASGAMLLNVANVGEVAPGAVTGFNGKSSSTLASAN